MKPYEFAIVGGGIVGLATAYSLLLEHPKSRLILLEKETELASHQTGHNSGVIHSGIYYKPGSLKAQNCQRGYQLLVDYCRKHDIPHDICGKIVVATEERELPPLQTLYDRGIANGLTNLKWLSPSQIQTYEPAATGLKALHVPQTGIIDYTTFSQHLAGEVRRLGGEIHLGQTVLSTTHQNGQHHIQCEHSHYKAKTLCTCAGLHSDKLAAQDDPELDLRIIPFRGEYYDLVPAKRNLVRNLIYPVPDPAFPFLGVHFTRMINGGVEAGPNAVLALAREGYTWADLNLKDLYHTLTWPGFWTLARKYWKTGLSEVHRSISKTEFTHALQKLIPSIQETDLVPANAGVRAQACHIDGSLLDDFHIIKSPNTIHVCNAPSPAATSSLAIGQTISKLINK